MLQHAFGQRRYDYSFNPIGVSVCHQNPYSENEPLFNHNCMNAEIALCKYFGQDLQKVTINYSGFLEDMIRDVYSKIGIEINFLNSFDDEQQADLPQFLEIDIRDPDCGKLIKSVRANNYVSLGILPSIKDQMNILGFISREGLNFPNLRYETEREDIKLFIDSIFRK